MKMDWLKGDPKLPAKLRFSERFLATTRRPEDLPQKIVAITRTSKGAWVIDEFGNPMPWRASYWRTDGETLVYIGF